MAVSLNTVFASLTSLKASSASCSISWNFCSMRTNSMRMSMQSETSIVTSRNARSMSAPAARSTSMVTFRLFLIGRIRFHSESKAILASWIVARSSATSSSSSRRSAPRWLLLRPLWVSLAMSALAGFTVSGGGRGFSPFASSGEGADWWREGRFPGSGCAPGSVTLRLLPGLLPSCSRGGGLGLVLRTAERLSAETGLTTIRWCWVCGEWQRLPLAGVTKVRCFSSSSSSSPASQGTTCRMACSTAWRTWRARSSGSVTENSRSFRCFFHRKCRTRFSICFF
mmetsp:Transcript_26420/g.63752  ORF Transcript_26420/g.63752 Transcript_26420/m.63752 type:complete len:283 (+) Transcript_26420:1244-2092(+)